MNDDPNIDMVMGESNVRFQGSPDEVRQWLLDNPIAQGCRVWVGHLQDFMIGYDYLAA